MTTKEKSDTQDEMRRTLLTSPNMQKSSSGTVQRDSATRLPPGGKPSSNFAPSFHPSTFTSSPSLLSTPLCQDGSLDVILVPYVLYREVYQGRRYRDHAARESQSFSSFPFASSSSKLIPSFPLRSLVRRSSLERVCLPSPSPPERTLRTDTVTTSTTR